MLVEHDIVDAAPYRRGCGLGYREDERLPQSPEEWDDEVDRAAQGQAEGIEDLPPTDIGLGSYDDVQDSHRGRSYAEDDADVRE